MCCADQSFGRLRKCALVSLMKSDRKETVHRALQEKKERKKVICARWIADLDELKFLICVWEKWVELTEWTDVKLQGRRDYRESVNRKKTRTNCRTFIWAANVWRGELLCSWYCWWRPGEVSGSSSGMSFDFEPSDLWNQVFIGLLRNQS